MHIEVNGLRTRYQLSGPDDAPVVVLSHSLGSSLRMWDPQMAALEGSYRVLRYDTRGHGASDAPAGAYSLDQLGDDAGHLLDRLGIDEVHWVGLSMGGMIGQNVALRFPERLASLALCDTMARIPADAAATWQERIATVESRGVAALTESTMQRWFTAPYLATDPTAVALIRAELEATPAAGFIGCCHAIRTLDNINRLSEIRMPTLIVVGEEDPGTPVSAARAMHERIAGSRLEVIAQAAHLSNVEQASRFNEILLEFLGAHG